MSHAAGHNCRTNFNHEKYHQLSSAAIGRVGSGDLLALFRMKTMSMVLKLSDCAETLEEARGVIDRQEERFRKQVEYSIALQRAIERHCAGEPVPEEIAKFCPHHAQKLNALRANKQI